MKFLNVDNVKQVFRLEKFDYPVFHEILAKLIWNIFIVVGIRWRTQSCHNLWERGAAPPSLPVSSVTRNGSNSYFLVNTLFDVFAEYSSDVQNTFEIWEFISFHT